MLLQESGEMYLETILILSGLTPKVRCMDIANYMGYSRPSITRAVSNLKEDGYIEMDKDEGITLTEKGKEVAGKIYSRHKLLANLFISLGVSEETANEDACRIEHIISEETINALRNSFGTGHGQTELNS